MYAKYLNPLNIISSKVDLDYAVKMKLLFKQIIAKIINFHVYNILHN